MAVTINSSVLFDRGELHDNSTDNEGGKFGFKRIMIRYRQLPLATIVQTKTQVINYIAYIDLEMTFGFSLFV